MENKGYLAMTLILLLVCPFSFGFTSTYDTATPAGTDDPREADDRMREIKEATRERLNVEMYFELTGTEVSDAKTGYLRHRVSVKAYGAVGDDPGNGTGTDDATAIQAAIDAASAGDTLYFHNGSYLIKAGLTCDKRLNWKGESPSGVEIVVNIDASTDALTIDGTSLSTQHTTIKNLSFISAAGKCRAAIKLSETHRSLFENVWIRTEGSDEGWDVEDTLSCTWINCGTEANASANSSSYGSPDRTFWFHEGAAGIGSNTHTLINTIIYGSAAGHYAINLTCIGSSEGNITIIGGNIENCTGSGLYLENVRGFRLERMHIEGITGTYGVYVKDSYDCKFDLWCASEDVYFENVDFSHVEGLVDNITFDSASHGNKIGNIDISGGSSLIDNGAGNVLVGIIRNSASSTYNDMGSIGGSPSDSSNLFTNADVSFWYEGLSGVPKGFTEKATVVISQESTIVKFGDYSCKVVADTAQEGVRFDSLNTLGGSHIDNEWISCSVWVYNATAGADIELQAFFTGSGRTAMIDSTTTTNTWTRLSAVTKMPSGQGNTDVAFQVIADDVGSATFYVDGITICQGVTAARSMMPSSNLDIREKVITRLATGKNVNMNTTDKTILYTIPTGMRAIITQVILRHPSDNIAGATDLNLGDGADADNWVQGLNVSSMNSTTDVWYINKSGLKSDVIYDAGDEFGIKPDAATGTTLNIAVDVFGYLFPG